MRYPLHGRDNLVFFWVNSGNLDMRPELHFYVFLPFRQLKLVVLQVRYTLRKSNKPKSSKFILINVTNKPKTQSSF
jgi:hypothetical protein